MKVYIVWHQGCNDCGNAGFIVGAFATEAAAEAEADRSLGSFGYSCLIAERTLEGYEGRDLRQEPKPPLLLPRE